ncbi:MAG: spondin domain-containing protein [Methylococcaceae bacterium]
MKKMTAKALSVLGLMTGLVTSHYVHASDYQVTVTNLTRGQPIGKILAIAHTNTVSAFQVGSPAIKEVAAIAQDGQTALLKALAQSAPQVVGGIYEGTSATPPGASTTFTLSTDGNKTSFTLLAMMVNTNDAFIGLPGIQLPTDATPSVQMLAAMDAGVEDNDENCLYIPGPFCNNPGKSSTVAGEGYIYISPGIHGIGSLPAAIYDWRNPAARVKIVKLN